MSHVVFLMRFQYETDELSELWGVIQKATSSYLFLANREKKNYRSIKKKEKEVKNNQNRNQIFWTRKEAKPTESASQTPTTSSTSSNTDQTKTSNNSDAKQKENIKQPDDIRKSENVKEKEKVDEEKKDTSTNKTDSKTTTKAKESQQNTITAKKDTATNTTDSKSITKSKEPQQNTIGDINNTITAKKDDNPPKKTQNFELLRVKKDKNTHTIVCKVDGKEISYYKDTIPSEYELKVWRDMKKIHPVYFKELQGPEKLKSLETIATSQFKLLHAEKLENQIWITYREGGGEERNPLKTFPLCHHTELLTSLAHKKEYHEFVEPTKTELLLREHREK